MDGFGFRWMNFLGLRLCCRNMMARAGAWKALSFSRWYVKVGGEGMVTASL